MGFWKKLAMASDARLAGACLRVFPGGSTLLIFVFHSLFESAEEIALNRMDPQQAITTGMFHSFAANLRDHGYRFVSPDEVVAGLDAGGSYAMITFDDGYANNRRALPTLEEFRAPAVFCISTNHVRTGKPFWWDVLYREGHKRGWPDDTLEDVRAALKGLRTCDAEKRVIAEFGIAAFQTVSDLDRPFTGAELATFAGHPLVHIGNHTSDHAILTNYSPAEARDEIRGAQEWLRTITGRVPEVIAYPNGNVSRPALQATHDAGIRLGMTVQTGRNTIPSTRSRTRALVLKRYTLRGTRDMAEQCRMARSPLSLQATWAGIRSKVTFTA